jgi:hypothetical protein
MERTWTDEHSGQFAARLKGMVEQVKESWYKWIPGWLPVCACICAGAMWIGQYTQSINDRLNSLEKEMQHIQDYLRSHNEKTGYQGSKRDYDGSQDSGLPQQSY